MNNFLHFHFQNAPMPTIFTLLLSSHICDTTTDDVVQILFNILWKRAITNGKRDKRQFIDWLQTIIVQISKTNGSDFTAQTMQKIMRMILQSVFNENDASSSIPSSNYRSNKNNNTENEIGKRSIYEKSNQWIWKQLFMHTDNDGNNVLMNLAKHEMDEVLEEILTNAITRKHISHAILSMRNKADQTLMGIVEIHGINMPESLSDLLKLEYACHGQDVIDAQICLSRQIETSLSSSEVIKSLKRFEPMTCCEKFYVFMSPVSYTHLTLPTNREV